MSKGKSSRAKSSSKKSTNKNTLKVSKHTRSGGKVKKHIRTYPDSSKSNNLSSK